MRAFIGTVPFTIIEAINYVVSNEVQDADLYLVKVFADAEKVGKQIEETGVFQNVYIVEDVLLTYPITVKKCMNVVKNGKNIIRALEKKKYDYCYYNNSGWLINSIFYTGVLKNNPDVKNIFLEHGYISYIRRYDQRPWQVGMLVKMAGLKCMDGTMLDEIHMFEPELNCVEQNGKIIKMKKFDKYNIRLKEALNKSFHYDTENNEYKDKRVIIMEQGPLKVEFDKAAFWNPILEILDLKQVIIKAHPRQKNSDFNGRGIAISRNHTLPWEIETLNHNMNDKVQITIFSGACTSSKMLFGDEPTVIFLYKLLPVDYSFLGTELVQFADKVGELYQDRSKYFIPETLGEFKEYCQKIGIAKE